jgi:glyoxylase-like metal-dependent hydrolase (beta-lactamase superfamily II)
VRLGPYEVSLLHGGSMQLDGGAIFGTLPKTVWAAHFPPAADNRLTLGVHFLLVAAPPHHILIDTGMGTHLPLSHRPHSSIHPPLPLEDQLARLGLQTEQITHVILTHLHFDHAGGTLRPSSDGTALEPRFPQAMHIIQRGEWEAACRPNEITRGGYHPAAFLPLMNKVPLCLLNGDHEILSGLWVRLTGGHTAHHQMVFITHADQSLFFPGDICPTSLHLQLDQQRPYDLHPLETLRARKQFLDQVLGTNAVIVFSHEPSGGFFRIDGSTGAPRAQPIDAT